MDEDFGHGAVMLRGARSVSRRAVLRSGGVGIAAALGAAGLASPILAQEATPVADQNLVPPGIEDGLSQEVVAAFQRLPGQKGLKLWAPPDAGRPEWSAALNPDSWLFIASAFKGFALAECLRLEEESLDPLSATPLAAQLNARLAQQLELNEEVFSPDAPVFNPPNLTGKVTLRTALEAMISHSDNTATDMVLRHVGAARVQAFVESIGLPETRIPTSTRQFIGYIFGLPNWQDTTWAELQSDVSDPPRPILNDTITMASTADELVSFYARALQGEFFHYAETLTVFRAILSARRCDRGLFATGRERLRQGRQHRVRGRQCPDLRRRYVCAGQVGLLCTVAQLDGRRDRTGRGCAGGIHRLRQDHLRTGERPSRCVARFWS